MVAWAVGERGSATALAVMTQLAARMDGRIQLTTDGHRLYLDARTRCLRLPGSTTPSS